MKIKINKKAYLLLIGALLFVGVAIIYHANVNKTNILSGKVINNISENNIKKSLCFTAP
ncbi:hypothetical protein BMS3Abin17_00398 [archaeon BMS3Abin17]|nr:hypothetical protein BMS3Abin17_00398 [archaeon BMS3Abin17]